MTKSKRFTPAQFRALDEVRKGKVTAVHQESPHMGKLRFTWYVDEEKQHSPITYDWLMDEGYITEEAAVGIDNKQNILITRKGETAFHTQVAMIQHRLANQQKNMAKTAAARKAQGQKENTD